MDQNAQMPTVLNGSWYLRVPMSVWNSTVIGALVLVAYWHVLTRLLNAWLEIPDYSHGLLVPIFACYLVWAKRKTLQNTKIAPAWSGIIVVALALALLLLGEFGAELFASRISLVVLFAGLILGFGGWQLLKELRFVLLVLLLAVPIPTIVFNQFALPLEGLASKLATALLHLMGVPALRLGNIIELPDMRLEVAEACSGLRSLVSLFTLAIFYGYFLENTYLRRTVLALASIPIAIAANSVRIFGTGMCVQYWDADRALGFFHQFSGWVMFLVSLGCLSIVHYVMLLFPIRLRSKS
jgi:exosortase